MNFEENRRMVSAKKPIYICLLGIDGSGKSTLSQRICNELQSRGFSASRLWWLEGENTLLRRTIRAGRNAKKSSTYALAGGSDQSKGNGRLGSFPVRYIYPRLVLLDYLAFGVKKTWIPRLSGSVDVILFDRYMYDVVFALSREFGYSDSKRERLFEIFRLLLPEPEITVIVDVPPETAYQRKREEFESVEQAIMMWENYQVLYSLIASRNTGLMIHVDNSVDIEDTVEALLKPILQRLEHGIPA
jgi:thymidylate kinase